MGRSLLEGWFENKVAPESLLIVEPNKNLSSEIFANFNLRCLTSANDLPKELNPRVILFAVKPQVMDEVICNYSKFYHPNTVFISIAAGKTIEYFQKGLSNNAAIIRAMPNTPAAVQRGITVACPNKFVLKPELHLAESLLASTGIVEWVEDEQLMDAVTALSGGGPAYVFLLTEYLSHAGVEMGIPVKLSQQLARFTVSGAGELLHQSSEDVKKLRQNVTSPGGTTAEALKILMESSKWQKIISRALKAAKQKSKDLAN